MMVTILQGMMALFGVAIAAACVFGILNPAGFVRYVASVWQQSSGVYLAVVVRVVLGVILLYIASDTRFPIFFQLFGGLALLGAVLIPFMGRGRIDRMLNWFTEQGSPLIRLWMLFGIAFGLFLAYGVGL